MPELLKAVKDLLDWFDDQEKRMFEQTVQRWPSDEEWDALGQGFPIESVRTAYAVAVAELTNVV